MIKNEKIIYAILRQLEQAETPNPYLNAKSVPGFNEQEVAYHMRLLNEEGHIEAIIKESNTGDGLINAAVAKRITATGHNLLDSLRGKFD